MAAKQRRLEARYQARPDLEQLLYERLFAGLGYAKNDDAMAVLARRVPLATARAVEDPIDREALFFGVADLLPSPADLLESDRATADYAMDLRDRFHRLQASQASVLWSERSGRFSDCDRRTFHRSVSHRGWPGFTGEPFCIAIQWAR